MNVSVVPPFDFGKSVRFIDGFAPCAADHHCEHNTLVTGGFVEEMPFVAHVTDVNDESNRLAVDVQWVDNPGDETAVAKWLAEFLSLNDDLTPLYEAARDDSAFERVVQDLSGLHHVRFPTPFEAACWAALSQQTPMNFAEQQKQAFIDACGRVVEYDDRRLSLFPTPTMVRNAAPTVHEVLDNERKAKTVLGAAAVFADESLVELGDEALIERLADIWGFGEWSSEFIYLRGFGRLDRIPTTEHRLREAVAEVYNLDAPEASDDDLDRLSERYGSMAGYWAHYIRVWAFQRDEDVAIAAN